MIWINFPCIKRSSFFSFIYVKFTYSRLYFPIYKHWFFVYWYMKSLILISINRFYTQSIAGCRGLLKINIKESFIKLHQYVKTKWCPIDSNIFPFKIRWYIISCSSRHLQLLQWSIHHLKIIHIIHIILHSQDFTIYSNLTLYRNVNIFQIA